MGAVVSARIFARLSATSLERGIPQRKVSAGLSPGKKARGRVLQRSKVTRNPSSPPFFATWVCPLLLHPPWSAKAAEERRVGKGPIAPALGGAPLRLGVWRHLKELGATSELWSHRKGNHGRGRGRWRIGMYQPGPQCPTGHTHLPAHPAGLPLAQRCPLPRPTPIPHPLPPRKRLGRRKTP